MNGLGSYYPLQIRSGNSRSLNVAVYQADGTTPLDMSAETVQCVFSQNNAPILTLTSGSGLTITLGNIAINLTSAQTALFDNKKAPKYELEFVTSSSNSPCLMYGEVRVLDGING